MFIQNNNNGDNIMWYTTTTFEYKWYYSYLELL